MYNIYATVCSPPRDYTLMGVSNSLILSIYLHPSYGIFLFITLWPSSVFDTYIHSNNNLSMHVVPVTKY